MAKMTSEEMIQQIESMSVLDLANMVKDLEEKFGVSAQAMAAPVAVAGGAAEEVEEQTAFDVVLLSFGDKKINVIKTVREVTSLGLKEAKQLVDDLPKPVKEAVSKEEADELKAKFEDAGAQVEVK